MTLTQTVTQMAGNARTVPPSTWNHVCSADGCTLASALEESTQASNSSSSTTESAAAEMTTNAAAKRGHELGLVVVAFALVFFGIL